MFENVLISGFSAFVGAFLGFLGAWYLQRQAYSKGHQLKEEERSKIVSASLLALLECMDKNETIIKDFKSSYYWPLIRLDFWAWDCISKQLSEHLNNPGMLRDLAYYFQRVSLLQKLSVERSTHNPNMKASENDEIAPYMREICSELRKSYESGQLHDRVKSHVS